MNKILVRAILTVLFGIILYVSLYVDNPLNYNESNTQIKTGICASIRKEKVNLPVSRFGKVPTKHVIQFDDGQEFYIAPSEIKFLPSELDNKAITIQFYKIESFDGLRIISLNCDGKNYFSAADVVKVHRKYWYGLSAIFIFVLIVEGTIVFWLIEEEINKKRREKRKILKKQKRKEAVARKKALEDTER